MTQRRLRSRFEFDAFGDGCGPAMLAWDIPPRAVADYLAWRQSSSRAVDEASRGRTFEARRLPRADLADIRCPHRGHRLGSVQRVAAGALLWPATAPPPSPPPSPLERREWLERRRKGPRDVAPVVGPPDLIDRGVPPTDPRVALLTLPDSLRGWVGLLTGLWCRCGQHVVDLLDLSQHFREVGVGVPAGRQPPVLLAACGHDEGYAERRVAQRPLSAC